MVLDGNTIHASFGFLGMVQVSAAILLAIMDIRQSTRNLS
jgi:hypothetical protein